MPATTPCSSTVELYDYSYGRLSEGDRKRVLAHLRGCRACEQAVAHMQERYQTSADGGSAVESRVDVPVVDAATFLLPPDGPDEIGWLAHYRVLRLLGQGGMGMVFEVVDSRLRRHAALKVMLPSLAADATYRGRFLREAQAMAAVTHDHIVTVYQVDVAQGRDNQEVPYLAMQLLSGESLESRVLRLGRLTAVDTIHIGRQIAEGLAAAHAHGLIHRDIKPANIFLESPRDRVKILDFGLARFAEGKSNLSQTGQFIGTPYYMSPEQGRGDEIDFRTDLFSFGCVLYVMLGGKLPFDGSHTMAVLTALAVKDPAPLAKLAPDAPAPLVELVHRLLEKRPEDRPPSAQAVAEMLEVLERGATLLLPGGLGTLPPGRSGAGPTAPLGATQAFQPPTTPIVPAASAPAGEPLAAASGVAAPPAPAPPPARSAWLVLAGLAMVALVALAAVGLIVRQRGDQKIDPAKPLSGEPIVVGILHSQTGTMRASEMPVVDMTRLAFDDLNEKGGLLGRKIRCILRDGASDERVFAREASRLIREEKVCALFGCWTSASRKAVKEVVEEHDHLLMYPVQYEGLEQSPNIVYLGATPDQQIFPTIDWCLRKGYKKYFLIGSDYVFPHAVNEIIKDRLAEAGVQVIGEKYLPLGTTVIHEAAAEILKARPDVVFNTINGDTNVAFFREIRDKGLSASRTPIVSFSVDETSLRNFNPRHVAGHLVAWTYFQALPGPINEAFVKHFRARYGDHRTVTDPMEAAWVGVQFWAKAVKEAGSTEPAAVRRAIRGQEIDAPQGPRIKIDPETQHTWKYFRLGRITEDSTIDIVENSNVLDSPEPYPTSRKRKEWDNFLMGLYKGWGNRWSSPGE